MTLSRVISLMQVRSHAKQGTLTVMTLPLPQEGTLTVMTLPQCWLTPQRSLQMSWQDGAALAAIHGFCLL